MSGALENDRKTLDQDLASSPLDKDLASTHCSLLSLLLLRSLAAQASSESRAELPGFLASSPIAALAGTEPATPAPETAGGGATRCHTWSTDLHHPRLGPPRAKPTLLHSPGQAA